MKRRPLSMIIMCVLIAALIMSACAPAAAPVPAQPTAAAAQPTTAAPAPSGEQVLKLATTTSTADSGLLDTILPDFEKLCNCRVDVVAVGTGQAIEIGAKGDAD
ncbi:MAG TPA: substrate-binding domain-containing protein, partial [Anaerolineae bacterium]|nr:substrate-binding domain-containing protein [Anaerolineae bacterium]